ncbi:hypothetical protein AVEN_46578-1 [Araneus ventricosus]|uniref:Uncharacterized protein n=1 Tax=Araneus ventricosus TaxID=182803 RepID=A0A4Y2MJ46_ARAVE|nr:hypothetical protein AVEN_46578-1 [Araneus ventricosus]
MLTRTDLNLEDAFWTRIKTVAVVRNYHWDRHIDVHDLVKCYLPRVNAFVDGKKESFALLCLLFELRTEYQKFPERRDYIRDVAKKGSCVNCKKERIWNVTHGMRCAE